MQRILANRRTLTILAFCAAALFPQMGQSQEIRWLRSAEQAAKAAAQTNRPILIYVRSAKCYYCDLMQKDVWKDKSAAAIVNRDFIPLKLTLEENAAAVESLKVKGYPTTLVFSAERAFVGRIEGYVKPDEFIKAMQVAKVAKAPTKLQR